MKEKHTAVAARSGMKAGLRAYMANIAMSGLPQVQDVYDELNELSSNDRFKWYCNKFGNDVAGARMGASASRRAKAQRREVVEAELSEIDVLRNRLAELEAAAATPKRVRAKAEPKAERKTIVATRITFRMSMALRRIARAKGISYEYAKIGDNSFSVKLDGRKLTPAKASAIIGASK